MCNDYEHHFAWAVYGKAMRALVFQIPGTRPNSSCRRRTMFGSGNGANRPLRRSRRRLSPHEGGFPKPEGRKGAPVFNFSSEGRQFTNGQRVVTTRSAGPLANAS